MCLDIRAYLDLTAVTFHGPHNATAVCHEHQHGQAARKSAAVVCAGVVRRLSENSALSPADSLGTAGLDGLSDVDRKQRELYTRQQQLLREQRTADQEKLLATISGSPSLLSPLQDA